MSKIKSQSVKAYESYIDSAVVDKNAKAIKSLLQETFLKFSKDKPPSSSDQESILMLIQAEANLLATYIVKEQQEHASWLISIFVSQGNDRLTLGQVSVLSDVVSNHKVAESFSFEASREIVRNICEKIMTPIVEAVKDKYPNQYKEKQQILEKINAALLEYSKPDTEDTDVPALGSSSHSDEEY